jgi:hypothetical protein
MNVLYMSLIRLHNELVEEGVDDDEDDEKEEEEDVK